MNTKRIMTTSALLLICLGILLTFAPEFLIQKLTIASSESSLLLAQIVGALYFANGMLNWMNKDSLIGGIYNRPVAIANFMHFLMGALAIGKIAIASFPNSKLILISGLIYAFWAIIFAVILFGNSLPSKK